MSHVDRTLRNVPFTTKIMTLQMFSVYILQYNDNFLTSWKPKYNLLLQ